MKLYNNDKLKCNHCGLVKTWVAIRANPNQCYRCKGKHSYFLYQQAPRVML